MARGGKREGSGRKKGVPNKMTADLKAAILGAFNAKGGQAYLEKVAEDQPQVFCSLLGKILPTTLAGDPDNPLVVETTSTVDRPVRESRDEFIRRRQGELLNGATTH